MSRDPSAKRARWALDCFQRYLRYERPDDLDRANEVWPSAWTSYGRRVTRTGGDLRCDELFAFLRACGFSLSGWMAWAHENRLRLEFPTEKDNPQIDPVLDLYLFELQLLAEHQVPSVRRQERLTRARKRSKPPTDSLDDPTLNSRQQQAVAWRLLGAASSSDLDRLRAWTRLCKLARIDALYSRSAYCARRALEYLGRLESPYRIDAGKLFQNVSFLARDLGHFQQALEALRLAREVFSEAGSRSHVGQSFVDQALIDFYCGRHHAVRISSELARRTLDPSELFHHLVLIELRVVVALAENERTDCVAALEDFVDFLRDHPSLESTTPALWHLSYHRGRYHLQFVSAQTALSHFETALRGRIDPMTRVLALLHAAAAALKLGRPREARKHVATVPTLLFGLPGEPCRLYRQLAAYIERQTLDSQQLLRWASRLVSPKERWQGSSSTCTGNGP